MVKKVFINEWKTSEGIPLSELDKNDLISIQSFAAKTHWFEAQFQPSTLHFKANQWIGQCIIPLASNKYIELHVKPKVPLESLMDWWCWSQRLEPFNSDLIPLECVSDVIEQLIQWLCQRVNRQVQKGLFASYQTYEAPLQTVKGRLLLRSTVLALQKGNVALYCKYQQRSVDNPENQILLWTLDCLRRYPIRNPRVRERVKQQYRALQGTISLVPYKASACLNRNYHRMNEHYRDLHVLCGMVLSHITLNEKLGDHAFPTFMLPINKIFEEAVANGLEAVLGKQFVLRKQYPYTVSKEPNCRFLMDLVIMDRASGEPLWVLDTKYKQGDKPSISDIQQVAAYAAALGINQCGLIYPTKVTQPLNGLIGKIQCKSLEASMEMKVIDSFSHSNWYELAGRPPTLKHNVKL